MKRFVSIILLLVLCLGCNVNKHTTKEVSYVDSIMMTTSKLVNIETETESSTQNETEIIEIYLSSADSGSNVLTLKDIYSDDFIETNRFNIDKILIKKQSSNNLERVNEKINSVDQQTQVQKETYVSKNKKENKKINIYNIIRISVLISIVVSIVILTKKLK